MWLQLNAWMKASGVHENFAKACGQLSWLIAATSCARGAEVGELGAERHHAVRAGTTRQARQRHRPGRGHVVHRRAASREVEALRAELGPGEVHGRIVAAAREVGRVLAAVAEIPQPEVGVVVPHVGKQHRRPRQVLEDLHRQRGVRVGFRRADDRWLRRAVGMVRVVEERLGDVGGGEVLGELALALDAAEVVAELLDQIDGAVVHAELAPQQLLGEAERGVGRRPVDLADGAVLR